MKKALLGFIIAACLIAFFLMYTQLTIFVIQPIGAVPDGRTLIIRRTGKLKFIDSADGLCAREFGRVNLVCRGVALGMIAKNETVLLSLPYSQTLYRISTDGKMYEK